MHARTRNVHRLRRSRQLDRRVPWNAALWRRVCAPLLLASASEASQAEHGRWWFMASGAWPVRLKAPTSMAILFLASISFYGVLRVLVVATGLQSDDPEKNLRRA